MKRADGAGAIRMPARLAFVATALGSVLLASCATLSKDAGFGEVQRIASERIGKDVSWQRTDDDTQSARATVKQLLGQELSADDAVQVALLNNRGLQATYQELGIAEADLVQASRLTNPHFAYLNTRNRSDGTSKIEWALTFQIMDLVTIPLRRKIETQRFEQTKMEVSGRMLDVAFETRRAYFRAVGAEELVRYFEEVKIAAEASAELARRMARVGNIPKITEMREQVFYAEAVAQLAQAKLAAVSARERLTRLMGLYGEDANFTLPARLPGLPERLPEQKDLEATAIAQRLDIQSAKRQTESVAEFLGLTKATRFINALELGPASTKEDPEPWKRGVEFSLQIPIFDWGDARVAKAEALYMQSVQRLAETAINARSEVRDAYAAAAIAYDTTRHYRDEIVPLRKKISEESLLRYNGMLISVFELLIDAREQIAGVTAYILSLRDFWLAGTDLQAALNGPSGVSVRAAAADSGMRMVPRPALAGH